MEEQEKRQANSRQTAPSASTRSAGGRSLSNLRVQDIENIYDRGFVSNFEEVFFYDEWKGMDGAEQNLHVRSEKQELPGESKKKK